MALRAALRSAARLLSSGGVRHASSSAEAAAASFALSERQADLKDACDAFASGELAPNAGEWDRNHHFPLDVLRAAGEMGLGSLFVPEEHGGTGCTRGDAAVVFESLARGDISVTAYLTIHNMNAALLSRFGSDKLRKEHLEPLCSLEHLSAYCLTEPGESRVFSSSMGRV